MSSDDDAFLGLNGAFPLDGMVRTVNLSSETHMFSGLYRGTRLQDVPRCVLFSIWEDV